MRNPFNKLPKTPFELLSQLSLGFVLASTAYSLQVALVVASFIVLTFLVASVVPLAKK